MTSTKYADIEVKGGFRTQPAGRLRAAAALLAVLAVAAPWPATAQHPPAEAFKETTTVTATAYNSLEGQGGGNDHSVAAWGDTLVPGMKAIAVSRDLIGAGLDYGTPVRIEGLDGVWYVRDKMHSRWQNKIDIYMGEDLDAARDWGRRRVVIHWGEE